MEFNSFSFNTREIESNGIGKKVERRKDYLKQTNKT
jgi:hypothetical protein